MKGKARDAGRLGMRSETFHLAAATTPDELLALVDELNARTDVHGILPQLPLPPQIDPDAVFERLRPEKDVDGLTPTNIGRLTLGRPRLVPCTPRGVLALIDEAGVEIQGSEAVVVGRSILVGKPTALLLLQRHATVTLCHSRTRDLGAETRRADILVAAVGQARMIRRGDGEARRRRDRRGRQPRGRRARRGRGLRRGARGRGRHHPDARRDRADDPRDADGEHARRGAVAARGAGVTYAEALRFLEDLIRPERPRRPYTDVKLARMRDLLARIGDPQAHLRAVLIAGTKGKGSTAVMVSEILRSAGLRVGLAVKPHLVDYRERIQVDGQMIPEDDLASLVEAVRPAVEAGNAGPWGLATYVEVTVAMAFWYFVRRQVDVAVVEVGIGGRLDATNTLDPVVSVITPISYDHTELLGTTLEAIAGEKAGIIRPGGRVVSAPQPPAADRVITAAAAAAGARLVRVGHDVAVRLEEASLSGVHAVIDGTGGRYDVRIPLIGRHQAQNAATAIAAVEALGDLGVPVPPEVVCAALGAVRWPARVELVSTRPYTIIDAGHNPASMTGAARHAARAARGAASGAPVRDAGDQGLPGRDRADRPPGAPGRYDAAGQPPRAHGGPAGRRGPAPHAERRGDRGPGAWRSPRRGA